MKKNTEISFRRISYTDLPGYCLGASYESEEGQAMIGPPSSQTEDGSEAFSDSPAEEPPPASTGTPPIPLRLRLRKR